MSYDVTGLREIQRNIYRGLTATAVADSLLTTEGFAMSTAQNGRGSNDDRAFVARYHSKRNHFVFAGVMDGIGGGAQGGLCADMALTGMLSHLVYAGVTGAERLGAAAVSANASVAARFSGKGGCTLVAVLADSCGIHGISAGDSYLFAGEAGQSLNSVAREDTIGAEMRRRGQATDVIHPKILKMITQFVGEPEKFIPHLFSLSDEMASRVVAASDGVHPEIAAANGGITPTEMIPLIMETQRTNGDNATVLCIDDIAGMSRLAAGDADHFLQVSLPFAVVEFDKNALFGKERQ